MKNQNTTNQDASQSEKDWKKWLIIFAIVITVIWFSAGIICNIWGDNWNAFKDIFNAINALFSGLAAAGMVVTLWMQKDELTQQRAATNEGTEAQLQQTETLKNLVEETRANTNALIQQGGVIERLQKEMEEQKIILAESLKQTGISRLEDIIYKTIDQHNNVINNLSGIIDDRRFERSEFLEQWVEIYINDAVDVCDKPYIHGDEDGILILDMNCLDFAMSKCINVILPIFKYIDETGILKDNEAGKEFDNKYRYFSWIMGTISYSELYLLRRYYWNNALYPDFKRICEKYALLEGIRLHENKSYYNDSSYYHEKARSKYINSKSPVLQ
ncbi:MAG: hypothetical protein IK131_05620 [Paludibacteraceae bacterium]|nr:hypothetical protein [Paludibacteraceae bacterium]